MKEPKVPDRSLSPEILKLTDKLAKDPKSKLFVPLAEEYIKSGMLDEAVMVLMDGLKVHSHFLTAQVALGKAYLEKGQIQEAKSQFEQVAVANPENLFVHRKLARIYKEEGQVERAMASCQAVLSLNPNDAEMESLMEELRGLSEKPVGAKAAQPSVLKSAPTALEPATAEPTTPTPATAMQATLPSQAVEEMASVSPPVEESPPAASVGEAEEIATEALADLYIQQGYYEKGIAVYQKLIARDPSNTALQRKLEETEVLIKLLTEGPKVKTRDQVQPSTEEGPRPPLSTPAPPMDENERQEAEKIRRLEAWLESIRKAQGR